MQKTTIIIPCYNEGTRLNCTAIQTFAKMNPQISFILVNDGSSDNTLEIINNLHKKNKAQINVISIETNRGKAEAVRQGFLEALSRETDFIGYWDADLATPLSEINNLISCFTDIGKTMVFGSRVKLLGRHIDRRSSRHYLGRFFATAVSLILRLAVYDTQCGAKIFRNTLELKAVFSQPFTVNWTFDVEIIARYIILSKYFNIKPVSKAAIEMPLQKWQDAPG